VLEESKMPKADNKAVTSSVKTWSSGSSSVEIEVNDKKYYPEELVLFKHFKPTLEVFF
jgi:hypothetical protein